MGSGMKSPESISLSVAAHTVAGRRGESMNKSQTRQSKPQLLWDRILALLQEDLAERRNEKVFVEVLGKAGPYHKEIGELSRMEIGRLQPRLRTHVVNRLLERYLAEQGHVDLLKKRHPYTKDIRDLTPEDLQALIEAEQEKVEEQREEREREEFVKEVRGTLDRLPLLSPL
jgi:hypothetical protein